MKLTLPTLALLSLGACAQLTGDPVKDCPAANLAVLNDQTGVDAAKLWAKSHPGENADLGVAAARIALSRALATQAQACPAPVI